MVVSVAAVSEEAVVPGAEVGSWVVQVAVFPLVVPVAGVSVVLGWVAEAPCMVQYPGTLLGR